MIRKVELSTATTTNSPPFTIPARREKVLRGEVTRRARCAPPPPGALHPDEQKRLLAVLARAKGVEADRDRMLVELLLTN